MNYGTCELGHYWELETTNQIVGVPHLRIFVDDTLGRRITDPIGTDPVVRIHGRLKRSVNQSMSISISGRRLAPGHMHRLKRSRLAV